MAIAIYIPFPPIGTMSVDEVSHLQSEMPRRKSTMENISAAGPNRRRLQVTFGLTLGYFIVEVVGGIVTNSLALLADAAHMLTDVGGLALALFAIWIAQKPATPQKTYGYYRVEILAALANAATLFLISFYILYEAYRRLKNRLRWQACRCSSSR